MLLTKNLAGMCLAIPGPAAGVGHRTDAAAGPFCLFANSESLFDRCWLKQVWNSALRCAMLIVVYRGGEIVSAGARELHLRSFF